MAELAHRELREAICTVGRSLFERGYVHSTAGNLSMRLPSGAGYLITPTDACLGFLKAEELAHVAEGGEQLSGARASKTLALHRRIYAAQPQAHCVLHTHSTHLVALTLQGVHRPDEVLPPITAYQVMKVGPVPLVPYTRPGAPEMAEMAVQHIERAVARGQRIRAVLCERLGPVVWHESPFAAMAVLEELEETAKLWVMSSPRPRPLTAAQVHELHQVFGT